MNYLGYTITPQQTHALIDHLTRLKDCYKASLQKQTDTCNVHHKLKHKGRKLTTSLIL